VVGYYGRAPLASDRGLVRVSSVEIGVEGMLVCLHCLENVFVLVFLCVRSFGGGELLKSDTAGPLTDMMDCCGFMSLIVLAWSGWGCSQVFQVEEKNVGTAFPSFI